MRIKGIGLAIGCMLPFAAALVPAASLAQSPDLKGRLSACQTDLATLCPGVDAGASRKVQCLAEHRAKLSPDCGLAVDIRLARKSARDALEAGIASGAVPLPAGPGDGKAPGATAPTTAPPAAKQTSPLAGLSRVALGACRADIEALCGSVAKGGGDRIRCLRESLAKVTPACAEALAVIDRIRADVTAACAADRKRLCQDGPVKGLACLQANRDSLSPACAAVIGAIPGIATSGTGSDKR